MLSESIQILRDKFKDTGLKIFSDNAILFDSTSDCTTLVWDDPNQLMYAFRPNNSHYNQSQKRMIVDVTEYVNIQYISSQVSREEMVTLLNSLKADNKVTDEVIAEILSSYDKLGSIK